MLEDLDSRVAKWAATAVRPHHVRPLKTLTHLGGTEVAVASGTVAAVVAARRTGSWRPAAYLLTVIGGQNLLHNLVKRRFRRRRPDGPHHSHFAGASFPSGHTATASAAWPAIVRCALPEPGRPATAAAIAAGPLVGATRVLLGVHWLSDVVAGLALGWSWLTLAERLGRRSGP